ncbi:unnamed protein product [Caenorhabditis angaria]|uniref:Exportin-T n=1 Tax=Caenorhabditis angaria TaxID=860376 RepID=A0A9P1IT99_9PELO|nr:unnamed protein product [Caenorhabditis angaria]
MGLCASSILEREQEEIVVELASLAQPAVEVLNNSDPDLSELSIDILKSYITFLLKFYPENTGLIEKVIQVALKRYVMGEDLNIDGDGEDETEFQEYRRELRGLLNSVGLKRPEMIIVALEPWTLEITANGGTQVQIHRIEALLHIIFHLHEIIPSNMLQSPREGISQRAARLPLLILEGLLLDGRSTTVHVTYFELACRYERLLTLQQPQQPAVIPQIAGAFLDQRGIAIPAVNVRTRIVYLFTRFVKAHKTVLSGLVSEVITRLAPLLAVSPQSDSNQTLSSDDQAYVFEATATLIVYGNLTTEMKAQYFGELSTTLAMRFENGLVELNAARARNADEETIQTILTFMSNVIIYCSRMSKAFNNVQSMKSCSCVDIYLKLLKLFIDTLSPENAFLLESTRQFAHRLVVSLEDELLPYLRGVFEKLALVSVDLDAMNHLLIFCHQAVAKFKKAMLTSGVDLGNVLAISARAAMQEQENITAAKDDSQRALIYVQRAFLQLLYTVICNDCIEALSNAGLLDHILEAAARLALSSDQTSQKVALGCLSKISQLSPTWSARTLRIALEVPTLPHITPSDAGSSIVVHEVCTTLTTLLQSDPNGFSQALRELLPNNNFSNQLLTALTTLKGKSLDREVMSLYTSLRQSIC